MENNWGAFFEHKACERIWINGRKDGETGLFYHNLICPFVGISCCTFIFAIDMHSFMARALPMITPSFIWAKLFFNIHIISYYSFLCWWYGIHILFFMNVRTTSLIFFSWTSYHRVNSRQTCKTENTGLCHHTMYR